VVVVITMPKAAVAASKDKPTFLDVSDLTIK